MNMTTATCGHSVLAIGQAGSPARNVVEQQPCAKCQTLPIDSLVAESHEIAARLAARMAGKEFTKVEHYTAAIGELMEMHAEREKAALRRHLVRLLERLGGIHEGLVHGIRLDGPLAEYVDSLGSLLADERRDL